MWKGPVIEQGLIVISKIDKGKAAAVDFNEVLQ
jgi:hypothetical protein